MTPVEILALFILIGAAIGVTWMNFDTFKKDDKEEQSAS